ncbi:MAG: hypothetical protein COC02_04665 [Rhodospirillaceae bacterium]|nr:MAG: hypothetical protein COC02_04665 [Rhodospirillaceae bacterium]
MRAVIFDQDLNVKRKTAHEQICDAQIPIYSALLLLTEGGQGDGYCIGNIKTYEINEVAKMFSNNIVYLEQRPGERLESSIDLSKMQSLGWKPNYGLEEYIKTRRKDNDT